MAYSKLLNKYYDPSNNSVTYLSNMKQAYLYLRNGAQDDLVDILFTDTKNDCLVFVFRRSEKTKELFKLWNDHELL